MFKNTHVEEHMFQQGLFQAPGFYFCWGGVLHQGMIPGQSFGGSTDSKHLRNERFPLGEPYSFKAKLQPIYSNTSSERIEFCCRFFLKQKNPTQDDSWTFWGLQLAISKNQNWLKSTSDTPKHFQISSNIKKKLIIV